MQAFEAPADLSMEAPVKAACSLAYVSAPSPGPGPVPSSERGVLRSVQQALAQEEDEAPLCPPPSFRSKVDRLVRAAGGEGRGVRGQRRGAVRFCSFLHHSQHCDVSEAIAAHVPRRCREHGVRAPRLEAPSNLPSVGVC